MKWIGTGGGPLILISQDAAAHWRGHPDDYERACTINDWLGVLAVGGAEALIVNDQPLDTAAWPTADGLLMVQWSAAPDEAAVVGHLERAGGLVFPSRALTVDFGSRQAVLFDSAWVAADVPEGEMLRLVLPSARCEVRSLDWQPDEDTRLVLHEIRACAEHRGQQG